jgi:hypothetical protein
MDRLTEEERAVVEKLAEAWNLFLQLPEQHPAHNQEMIGKIHDAQRIIYARVVERQEGLVHEPNEKYVVNVNGISRTWHDNTFCRREILEISGVDDPDDCVLWVIPRDHDEEVPLCDKIDHDDRLYLRNGLNKFIVHSKAVSYTHIRE